MGSIKFVTNSISMKSRVPTLSDIVKTAQTKVAMAATVKTASAVAPAAPVKTASTDTVVAEVDLAKEAGRGNVKNLTAPKFGPGGKVVKEESKKDDKKDDKKPCKATAAAPVKVAEKGESDEGEDSKQPTVESKLVNDPHKDPKLKKNKGGGKGSSESDEAESSGQLDVEPLHQKGESTGEKKSDDKKEAKIVDRNRKSAQSVLHAWVKVANMTPAQKEFVRKTWSKYWPKSFIDAVLVDR